MRRSSCVLENIQIVDVVKSVHANAHAQFSTKDSGWQENGPMLLRFENLNKKTSFDAVEIPVCPAGFKQADDLGVFDVAGKNAVFRNAAE